MDKRLTRREWLGAAAALTATLGACASPSTSTAKAVVVGGGFGGATAARYLRLWSDGRIDVTLIEPNTQFVSCPMSNLVLGGSKTLGDITYDYSGLRRLGVNVVHDSAAAIDADRREVRLASGDRVRYEHMDTGSTDHASIDEVLATLRKP